MRRRSSNDGVLSASQSLLPMRSGLVQSLMNSMPPKQNPRRKPKPHSRPPAVGPDEMVLEIRRLREQRGMTCRQIRVHMASLGFNLTVGRITNITEYYTRSHLVPAPNAAPYITKEPSCTT